MVHLPGVRFLSAFFVALLFAGCDSNGPDRPEQDVTVQAHTFTFRLDDASFDGRFASVQYETNLITPSVTDKGAVLAYFWDQETWTALPYTFAIESEEVPAVDYTVELAFAYDDQFLEIFYEASNPDVAFAANQTLIPEVVDIKLVVIEGFPAGRLEVDPNDYEAVKRRFNLDE